MDRDLARRIVARCVPTTSLRTITSMTKEQIMERFEEIQSDVMTEVEGRIDFSTAIDKLEGEVQSAVSCETVIDLFENLKEAFKTIDDLEDNIVMVRKDIARLVKKAEKLAANQPDDEE
jgi:hypothetical protein